jgi:hypothetical protein
MTEMGRTFVVPKAMFPVVRGTRNHEEHIKYGKINYRLHGDSKLLSGFRWPKIFKPYEP